MPRTAETSHPHPSQVRTRRPRSRWWQILLRAVLVVCLLAAALGVTLPWWLPEGLTRRWLEQRLTHQAGTTCRIESISMSWTGGVEIRGLEVASGDPFEGNVLDIPLLWCELDPLRLLVREEIEWMRLKGARVVVRVDADGRTNLAPLRRLGEGARVKRMSVARGKLVAHLPRAPEPIRVAINDLQLLAGRTGPLGRVSLSAGLVQVDRPAPISFRASTASTAPGVAGIGALSFRRVDLAQVPLIDVLNLPLHRLAGQSAGQVTLRVNDRGVIDRFEVDVRVDRLDVQPGEEAPGPSADDRAGGGISLPVIEHAGLELTGKVDPLAPGGGQVRLSAVRVRLPGLDAQGQADLVMDALRGGASGASPPSGGGQRALVPPAAWEALRSFELLGEVRPSHMAAVVTGSPVLAGGLVIEEPVAVRAAARRDGATLSVDFALDATDADVRRGASGPVLKPPGRTARAHLTASLRRRTWTVQVDRIELALAENRFTGRGRLEGVRHLLDASWRPREAPQPAQAGTQRAADRADDAPPSSPPAQPAAPLGDQPAVEPGAAGHPLLVHILAEMEHLRGSGTWRLADLPALADAFAWPRGRLAGVRLDGPVNGAVSVTPPTDDLQAEPSPGGPARGVHVDLLAEVPAETEMVIPGIFSKPSGAGMRIRASGWVDSSGRGVRGFRAGLALGDGNIEVVDAAVRTDLARIGRGAPEFYARANVRVEAVEHLLPSMRVGPGAGVLQARVRGDLTASVTGGIGEQLAGMELKTDLSGLEIAIPDRLHKPAAQPLSATLALVQPQPLESPSQQVRLTAAWMGSTATLEADLPEGLRQAALRGTGRATAEIDDARLLIDALPPVRRALDAGSARGPLVIDASGSWRAGSLQAEASCDATGLEYGDPAGRHKRAGVPCRLAARGRFDAGLRTMVVEVTDASVRLGEDVGNFAARAIWGAGDVLTGGRGLPLPGGLAILPPPRTDEFSAGGKIRWSWDGALTRLLPELARAAEALRLDGEASLAADLSAGRGGAELTARLNATDTSAGPIALEPASGQGGPARTFHKPVGEQAVADLDLSLPAGEPAGSTSRTVRLRDLSIRLGGLSVVADGRFTVAGGAPPTVDAREVQVAVGAANAASLATLLPWLEAYEPRGAFLIDAKATDGGLEWVQAHWRDYRARWHDKEVTLDGELSVSGVTAAPGSLAEDPGRAEPVAASEPGGQDTSGRTRQKPVRLGENLARLGALVTGAAESRLPRVRRIRTEGLRFAAGENRGWLIADIENPPTAFDVDTAAAPRAPMRGRFDLHWQEVDDRDLGAWLTGPPGVSPPDTDDPPGGSGELTEDQRRRLRGRGQQVLALLRAWFGEADVSGTVTAERMRTFISGVGVTHEAREFIAELTASAGRLEARYAGGVSGGTIQGVSGTDLGAREPVLRSRTVQRNLQAGPAIRKQVAWQFPGNTVFGKFHRTRDIAVRLADRLGATMDERLDAYPVGESRTVLVDGVVEGQGAPDFVTAVFPGLNLTRYRYETMTNFARHLPDGTTEDDMVYDGRVYDLYMEGTTDPEGFARYTVGLILLGTPQSAEFNHLYRQGRIPLLKVAGRIQDGEFQDIRVSYPWPNETLFTVFLKNNIFYRLWLRARSEGEVDPIGQPPDPQESPAGASDGRRGAPRRNAGRRGTRPGLTQSKGGEAAP